MNCVCAIYRCSKKEGMYLYVDKKTPLNTLPEVLQQQIGATELAMTLLISPDKKLAQASAKDVLEAIERQGFYLQMPPSVMEIHNEAAAIREKNAKL